MGRLVRCGLWFAASVSLMGLAFLLVLCGRVSSVWWGLACGVGGVACWWRSMRLLEDLT